MILLTGATGYVGQNFVRYMHNLFPEKKLLLLIRHEKQKKLFDHPEDLEFIIGDIQNPNLSQKVDQELSHVIHLASRIEAPSESHFRSVNVDGTANIVRLAENKKAKLIYLSSYDVQHNYLTPYARSKRDAEKVITDSDIPYLILRPTVLYGLKGKHAFSNLTQGIKSWNVALMLEDGSLKLQPLYLMDLLQILSQCLELDLRNLIIPIGGPYPVSQRSIIQLIAEKNHKKPRIVSLKLQTIEFFLKIFSFHSFFRNKYETLQALKKDKILSKSSLHDCFDITLTPFPANL